MADSDVAVETERTEHAGTTGQRAVEGASAFERIVTRLTENASVETVYGDPVERGDRTLIPVAKVAYGFGGGSGEDEESTGFGGGGGVSATPVGALEVGPDGTRFVRYDDRRGLLGAALLGVVVGLVLGRRRG